MASRAHESDARRRQTREALFGALTALVLRHRYEDIRIDDILAMASVGRSTFYEHFRGKDALLVANMESALAVLSSLTEPAFDLAATSRLLEHFRVHRVLARNLFDGAAQRVIRGALAVDIEHRLCRMTDAQWLMPRRLAARALADGMLSPLVGWLSGEAACNADDLAAALRASSRAMLAGLRLRVSGMNPTY
jgi:AcrR family transcriptional regulator